MATHYIPKKKYLELGQLFHWATKDHYIRMFMCSGERRHSRTEKLLPKLVERKKLVAVRYDGRLVYSVPRRCRGKNAKSVYRIEHGLACTEALVRIWLSDTEVTVYGEHKFRRYKIVPEWGIKYPSGSALLFEYSTEDNFSRISVIEKKLERYMVNLKKVADGMNCKDAFVLFVVETDRNTLKRFIKDRDYLEDFFFTDYQTFLEVGPRMQLIRPIYIWGGNGKEYSISHD